ncbi:hypothetical protein [Mycolicibacterium sphagni]|uniref:hypothetical protein n=1 Tax=Mycolicibacterium sphagni TaxID=1786 RepID=UPI0013FD9D4F|nr:hypothetical protein [Mycolicibacterium sphagni]
MEDTRATRIRQLVEQADALAAELTAEVGGERRIVLTSIRRGCKGIRNDVARLEAI